MVQLPKQSASKHIVVILSGGSGPRLWPLSTLSNPKQFLKINSQQSLLNQTINRVSKICPTKYIYIVTNYKYKKIIVNHLPKNFPNQNIIFEPAKKNTLMAMLYSGLLIDKIYPNPILTFLPSDQLIKNRHHFINQIKTGAKTATQTNKLVIYGLTPKYDNPSFGYAITSPVTKQKYLKVDKFVEKPDLALIKKISKPHATFWNSGIYTFRLNSLLAQISQHQPQYSINLTLTKPIQAYKKCPNLSIDVAISQKTDQLLAIPAKFSMIDIGQWASIFDILPKNKQAIAKLNKQDTFVSVESNHCLVSGQTGKLIGLVGVDNLAIIDTPQATLICRLDKSLHVRDLVGKIVRQKKIRHHFIDIND